jgi:hypothetical protein
LSEKNYSAEKLKELLREKLNPGLSLLLAEEFARETGAELARKMPRPREMITKTLDKVNEPVRYKLDIIKVDAPGRLREFTIKSPTPNFSLLIMTDGVRRVDRPYSELAKLSPQSNIIEAFQDAENGVYVLSIKDISWAKSGLVTLYVDIGTITFSSLWAVWEEHTEK